MQSYVFARKQARFLPAFVGTLLGVMLSLMPSPALATDEIVVKSSPLGENPSDIISTTHILTTEDINRLSGLPIGRVLNNLAGVDVAAYGPAVGRPVIRGLTGYRVAVLQNGMLPGDVSPTAEDHANADATFDTSRIEVLKGPSALRYGPYAATGVVNSFSRHLAADDDPATHLQLSAGSAADESGTAFFVRRSPGNVSVSLSGHYLDAGNMRIPTHAESEYQLRSEDEDIIDAAGDAENTDRRIQGATGALIWQNDRDRLSLAIGRHEMRYGVPGHAHEEHHHDEEEAEEEGDDHHEEAGEAVYIDMQRTNIRLDYSRALTGFVKSVNLQLGYADYGHDEFEEGSIGSSFALKQTEYRLEMPHQPIRGWQGIIGANGLEADMSVSGDEAFLPASDDSRFGVYLLEKRKDGQWLTELAARLDQVSLASGAESPDFNLTNLSVGVGYKMGGQSLIGGSLAQTERAPSVNELFAEGMHVGARRYERGDANLDAEEGLAVEAYFRHSFGATGFTASVFRNDYDNFIYLADTGEHVPHEGEEGEGEGEEGEDEEEDTIFEYRQNGAEIDGIELEVTRRGEASFGRWMLRANYARLRGSLRKGAPLPTIPPEKVNLTAELSRGTVDVNLHLQYAADQTRVPQGIFPTDGYLRTDVSLNWRPAAYDGLVLSVAAENLTDEEIRYHASALKDLLPEAGRNFRLTARYKF